MRERERERKRQTEGEREGVRERETEGEKERDRGRERDRQREGGGKGERGRGRGRGRGKETEGEGEGERGSEGERERDHKSSFLSFFVALDHILGAIPHPKLALPGYSNPTMSWCFSQLMAWSTTCITFQLEVCSEAVGIDMKKLHHPQLSLFLEPQGWQRIENAECDGAHTRQ